MNQWVMIKEPRLVLENVPPSVSQLCVKIGIGRKIYRFLHFRLNDDFRRWERKEEIIFPWTDSETLEFEIYYSHFQEPMHSVVGESLIAVSTILRSVVSQLKIPVCYNGDGVGWIYCQILLNSSVQSFRSQFIRLRKINFSMLYSTLENVQYALFLNSKGFLQKNSPLHVSKEVEETSCLDIKLEVKLSDYLVIRFPSKREAYQPINILMDDLARGRVVRGEHIIKNKIGTRVGILHLEYFLENLFLQNAELMPLQKTPVEVVDTGETQQSRFRRKIQEADLKVISINTTIQQLKKGGKKHLRGSDRTCKSTVCYKRGTENEAYKEKKKLEITQQSVSEKLKFYFNLAKSGS